MCDESKSYFEVCRGKILIEDSGLLKWFLGIEILENENVLCTSLQKYCLKLNVFGLLESKSFVELNLVVLGQGSNNLSANVSFLTNLIKYQNLAGKLVCLGRC